MLTWPQFGVAVVVVVVAFEFRTWLCQYKKEWGATWANVTMNSTNHTETIPGHTVSKYFRLYVIPVITALSFLVGIIILPIISSCKFFHFASCFCLTICWQLRNLAKRTQFSIQSLVSRCPVARWPALLISIRSNLIHNRIRFWNFILAPKVDRKVPHFFERRMPTMMNWWSPKSPIQWWSSLIENKRKKTVYHLYSPSGGAKLRLQTSKQLNFRKN